ncbi:MAG: acyl-CoA dehydrogenase family protein, partial [Desulfosalsimonadaceae bacterium]|nr:acyl-CoA dehydrogenase family protein [Desulfosalsimonadaceae bacterium]
MNFTISEKMKVILDMVNEFVDRELIPLEPAFLSRPMSEVGPIIAEKQKKVKQMELWGPCYPKELGGMGLNLMEHALVSEALGRTPLGHFVFWCQAPDVGNIELLEMFANEEQKKTWL